MAKKTKDPNNPSVLELPPREASANRAEANGRTKKHATRPTQPVSITLAGQRSRRNVPEKAYSKDHGPVEVVRREPVRQVPVARLDGQDDIPSSDDNLFAARKTLGGTASMSDDTSGSQVENLTDQPDTGSSTPGDYHPFGSFGFSSAGSQSQGLPQIPVDNSNPSYLPNTTSNQYDFSDINWNNFHPDSLEPMNQINTAFPNSRYPFPVSASIDQQNTATTEPGGDFNLPSASLPPEHGVSQYVVSDPSMSTINALPALNPSCHFPSYTSLAASPYPLASTRATNDVAINNITLTPARRPTTAAQARIWAKNKSKLASSQTPQKKLMKANAAAHYAIQRTHQQRKGRATRTPKPTGSNKVPQPIQDVATASVQAPEPSTGLTSDQLAVCLPMRKFIGYHLLTRSAWPLDRAPIHKAALEYARTVPGIGELRDVWVDDEFARQLKSKESTLRGEFVDVIKTIVKDHYGVSPSTGKHIDSLIQDDRFLYKDEMVTPRKERGFFSSDAIFQAVGAILFEHPHNLGTLFIAELCADDPPKKWHAKAKDKSATKGVPVGLLAFIAVAIRNTLECIRDRGPSSRKIYKFEQVRYGSAWTRYRKELIKYKHLGALRLEHLEQIKQRYNETHRVGAGGSDDSDVDDDSDDDDMSSGYGSDDLHDADEVERPADDVYEGLDEGSDSSV